MWHRMHFYNFVWDVLEPVEKKDQPLKKKHGFASLGSFCKFGVILVEPVENSQPKKNRLTKGTNFQF